MAGTISCLRSALFLRFSKNLPSFIPISINKANGMEHYLSVVTEVEKGTDISLVSYLSDVGGCGPDNASI